MRASRFSVRPRTVVIAMAVIVLVAAAAVSLSLYLNRNPGRVRLQGLSEDSTATVGFAGMFPAQDDEGLANPLGIATDGELLYVAESDAGRIRIFDLQGGVVGDIGLPLAEGRTSVYPSALALADDDRVAVVDNAASRVIVVSRDPAESAEVLLTLGEDASSQPTSVAFAEGEYFVFDAAVQAIHVYSAEGELDRTIADGLEPKLTFASGLSIVGDSLFAVDSNGGRVLELDPRTGEQLGIFQDRYTLPRMIVPIADERMAVVDTFERSVFLTARDGTREGSIDAETVPDGPLGSPRGAAWIDADARLYVTDAVVGRIMVYNIRASQGDR